MTEALPDGKYRQPALSTVAPTEDWRACFATFTASLLIDGYPIRQTADGFFEAARALLNQIAALAATADTPAATVFLENPPHNLFAIDSLTQIAPNARFRAR
jgi:hypothetical protein